MLVLVLVVNGAVSVEEEKVTWWSPQNATPLRPQQASPEVGVDDQQVAFGLKPFGGTPERRSPHCAVC